ncbi:MAG TPA: hypothetical protein VMW72_17015 [Sedimentisphaerales bacterium]|nr:hypothetical protein [Sedimentisphaerales bacterium]
MRSDLRALRKDINNVIGPHQNNFENQNRLGFPPHHQRTSAEQTIYTISQPFVWSMVCGSNARQCQTFCGQEDGLDNVSHVEDRQ